MVTDFCHRRRKGQTQTQRLQYGDCGGKKKVFKNINRSHRVRRLTRQLKHHQRALARKQKGSKNRFKERLKVQGIYGKLQHIRKDYTHKVTIALVSMLPREIVLEDLNISGMLRNRHLATIIEVSVHMSVEMAFLAYMGKVQSGTNPIFLSNAKSFVLVL